MTRLRIALNSSDYSIVANGLSAFKEKILIEHEAVHSFGYQGRCYPTTTSTGYDDLYYKQLLNSAHPEEVQGELAVFIRSSPMLEELFQLWDLPARDEDKVLCMNHMTCLAAILHCSQSNLSFCNAIVNRILQGYVKSIHWQLLCGHTGLAHATLGLLIAIARTSGQNSHYLHQKLPFEHESTLKHVMPGKQISSGTNNEEILKTDARYLLIILTLVLMKTGNTDMVNDMLSKNSLLRKLLSTMTKDTSDGVALLLSGIRLVQSSHYYLSAGIRNQLVDDFVLSNVVTIMESEDKYLQQCAFKFLEDFVQHAMKLPEGTKRLGLNKSRSIAHRILKLVDGSKSLHFLKVHGYSLDCM